MREYETQRLFGNLSGYIGFFLGYSLFQIPNLLRCLYQMGKERIDTKRKTQSSLKSTTHLDESISKGRIMERNIDEELKRYNNELYQLSKKFQELHDLMRS